MPTIKTPTKSVTGPQLKTGQGVILIGATKPDVAELPQYDVGTLTPTKIRTMRKDPTIALVRQLIVAPALLSPWAYEEKEGAPKGAAEFIEEQIQPLRSYMIRQTLLGCVDFGWAPFEKIFAKKENNNRIGLSKMKPLLQDWTDIMVHPDNGAFWGFKQYNSKAAEVFIPVAQAFLHSFDVEGTYWYGQGLMANAETGYDNWDNINDASNRYDTKIAGSHWVVHYPMGTSNYNGTETDNEEIARALLASLQSSGGIAVPKNMEDFIKELNENTPKAWEIELLTDSGSTSASFTDRQKYYDALKVRGFGFPERSILEGQFGTKAEAEAHGDFAIANILLRTEDMIRDLNWHCVNQLLRINWGPDKENTVAVTGGALGKENRAFLQTLYTSLLAKPEGFTAEFDNIDRGALRDLLEVPTDEEAAAEEKELDNGIRDTKRPGDDLRPDEHQQVGGPGQQRGPDDDISKDSVGDSEGGRESGQPAAKRAVDNSVRDDADDDN